MKSSLLIAFIVLFITGLDIALAHRGMLPAPPALILSVLIALIFLLHWVCYPARMLLRPLAYTRQTTRFLIGIVALAVLSSGWNLRTTISDPTYIVLALLSLPIVLAGAIAGLQLGPQKTRLALYIAFGLLALSIILDLVKPGLIGIRSLRPAGISGNPNKAALELLLLFCLLFNDCRLRRVRIFAAAILVLSVLATQSRGGFLNLLYCFISLIVFFPRTLLPKKASALIYIAVISFMMFVSVGFWMQSEVMQIASYQRRLERISQVDFRSISHEGRYQLIQDAWQVIKQKPFFGHGTGSVHGRATTTPPHNLYLRFWIEYGLVGPLLLIVLVINGIRTGRHFRLPDWQLFWSAVAIGGVFTHNLFESRTFLIGTGLLIASYVTNRHSAMNLAARSNASLRKST